MADPLDYSGLLSDWEQRLKNYQGFGPSFEQMRTDTPEYSRLNKAAAGLEDVTESSDPGLLKSRAQEFRDAFVANKEALQQRSTSWGTPPRPVGELLGEFYKAAPEARQSAYFSPDQFRHEIYSHLYPYKEGIAPDYRSFKGFSKDFPATPITPLNEGLAVSTDVGMERGNKVFTQPDPKSFAASLQRFVPNVSQADVPVGKPEGFDIWNKLFGTGHTEQDLSRIKNIGQMFQEKYVGPATQRYINLTNLQIPESIPSYAEERLGPVIASYKKQQNLESLLDRTNYALANIAEERGQPIPPDFFEKGFLEKNLLYAQDPVSAAARGAKEMVRRNPTGAALGLSASLLTSGTPTALAKGQFGTAAQNVARDVALGTATEAGTRLAGTALQRIAPSAAAVINPAVASVARFAGPAGLTYSGITGANEFVRAATGESIPTKVRQFLGTQERTGATSPYAAQTRRIQESRPADFIPSIRAQTPQERAYMQSRQNENEWQRRQRLAAERFNPSKGEFGLSELLFGR